MKALLVYLHNETDVFACFSNVLLFKASRNFGTPLLSNSIVLVAIYSVQSIRSCSVFSNKLINKFSQSTVPLPLPKGTIQRLSIQTSIPVPSSK